MIIQRAAPVNELLAKLIFLILPTSVVGYFLLQQLNEYYTILQNDAFIQAVYLGSGIALSALFYSFRFRFLPTFTLLILAMYTLYTGLDKYESGEFDAFFIARQFQVACILFGSGWLMGWGFLRIRYWSVVIATLALTGCVLVIAKSNIETVPGLLQTFAPALLYSIYIVFTSEQIYNYKDKTARFWWFLSRRLAIFLLIASAFLGGIIWWQMGDIKATVDNYGGKGQQGKNSMLNKNKDNTFDLKDYSRLSGALGRSNELLFCAHIDNFFPNTDVPNPLYLTAFYYTRFDTATETFERDSTIPFNDLFEPDPSKIPLFNTRYDSSVIRNSMGEKLRQTVEVEIYCKTLSPATYLAPNVGYFVQPITIEKDFRDQFRYAYRTKSYVSALNSAYFIYNVQNPEVKKFQEMRFDVLRKIPNYEGVDGKFIAYYTRMPADKKFSSISELAHKITDTAHTPVDKVLAIRNYFLSKDENGKRLYEYTDNPGIPDLPNASKLMYFLNDNHKGYCAYFAGATLFMLRSLGIPSRIAVGFLTEERSDKNKGWYWYYANQAHAWVQVYFPGYGWLDFDTTVGNDGENRTTPQPDGTPPMQPPKAWLAAEGVVIDVDTLKKALKMFVKQFVFHDNEYKPAKGTEMTLEMKVAVVYKDSIAIPLRNIKAGDIGTAVSYSEELKRMEVKNSESAGDLVKRLPASIPTDEVYLKRTDLAPKQEKQQPQLTETVIPVRKVLLTALLILSAMIVALLALPGIIWQYYLLRFRNANAATNKPYWAFRAATYYLHMCGIMRGSLTPLQYARYVVDKDMGTDMASFMNIYLKKKYAKQELTESEQHRVNQFLIPFLHSIRQKVSVSSRLTGFLNPVRCASFFVNPDNEQG